MFFLSGIHGVGKTTIGKRLENELQLKCYTASALIEHGTGHGMSLDKKVSDIVYNQTALVEEVEKLKTYNRNFILEGHLCVLDANGNVQRISSDTFFKMNPRRIIVLVDDVSKIAERNHGRGDRLSSEEFLRDFQQAEVDYGEVIGQLLQIPVQISKNDEAGFKDILSFLRQMEEKEDERDPFVNKAGIC